MNPKIRQYPTLHSALRKAGMAGFSALAFLTLAGSAKADLVQNGGFELTSTIVGAGNPSNGSTGQLSYNINATDWTNGGYNFIFAPTVAGGNVASSQFGANDVSLYGAGPSGSGTVPPSPSGGNYLASDPVFQQGPISQTINGLTIGDQYTVGFYWAGAQQVGFTGPTTEGWDVSLGSQTQDTTIVNNASQGFTGWMFQTFTYTATGTSEVLSFMSEGGPAQGQFPPFALLDGVSLNQTPEPAFFIPGLGLLGLMVGLGVLRSKKSVKN